MNPPTHESLEDLMALRPRLTSLARRLLADEHGAEDLVQDAWVRALERAPSASPGETTGGWWFQVVRHLAVDHRRADGRRARRERAAAEERSGVDPGPDAVADRLRLQREIVEAVLELEEPLRSTAHARYFDELPPRAIAARDGVSIHTINDRLRRARRRLRQRLATHLDPAGDGTGANLGLALLPLAALSPRAEAALLSGAGFAATGSASVPLLLETLLMKKALVATLFVLALVGGIGWMSSVPATTSATADLAAPETRVPADLDKKAPELAEEEVGAETTERSAVLGGAPAPTEGVASWTLAARATFGLEDPAPGMPLLLRVLKGTEGDEVLHEQTFTSDRAGHIEWSIPAPDTTVRVHVKCTAEDIDQHNVTVVAATGSPAPETLHLSLYPLDASIEGTVTDESGRPIEGARVFTARETVTDERGEFQLATSSYRSQEFVSCRASGHAQDRQIVEAPDPDGVAVADFALRPEVVLAGRVVDEFGTPVPEARISTFFGSRDGATTDARGEFRLVNLDPGHENHSVKVEREGFASSTESIPTREMVASSETREFVLKRGARVEGQIVDTAGTGIPGALVLLGFSPNAWNLLHTYADEEGRFRIDCANAGPQKLFVRHEIYAPGQLDFEVGEGESLVRGLEVQLGRGRTLAGNVVQADGSPVPGIGVAARHLGENTNLRAESDAEGHFVLEHVPSEEVELSFWGDGWLRHKWEAPSGSQENIEIVLERAGQIAGRVVDASTGASIPDFLVRLDRSRTQGKNVSLWATWVREGHRFTDPDGRWTTEGLELPVGVTMAVDVRAVGYAPARIRNAAVQLAGSGSELVIALEPGQRVAGRVVNGRTGEPVEGAVVKLLFDQEQGMEEGDTLIFSWLDGAWNQPVTRSTGEGDFLFEQVGAGRYWVNVEHPDFQGEWRSNAFEVQSGVAPTALLIEIGGSLSIRGTLLDGAGAPRSHATVKLVPVEVRGMHGAEGQRATTDGAGRFVFPGLSEGFYQVGEEREGRIEGGLGVVLRGTQSADVTLGRAGGARLTGTLVCDLELPEDLTVRLTGSPGEARTFPMVVAYREALFQEGTFTFEGLEPGSYVLTAHYWSEAGDRQASAAIELLEDEEKTLTLELLPR